jgi:deoxyribonuclease-4
VNALEEAERLRLDCIQIFTKNQRQWRVPPLSEDDREAWLAKLREMGWASRRGPARTVSHNSYLINLASPDPVIWRRSVKLQRIELERCETLGIRCCVAHPGAHMGSAPARGEPHELRRRPTRHESSGLRRIIKALDRLHRDLPGYRTLTCLETTAGAGSTLGFDFGQLAAIADGVADSSRVAFCLDTCHVTAAGYDMSTTAAARAVLQEWDSICRLRRLRVLHLNDSTGGPGSRLDRHAHIGEGCCGRSCFRAILNHAALRRVPKILETPKGTTAKGTPWDLVNIRRLKRLAEAKRSSR